MKKLLKGYLIAILGLVFLIVLTLGMFAGNSNQCQSTNTSVTVTTSADKEAVAQSIHDNLKKVSGVTEAGIAGYLGNMEVESGFNPKSIESSATYDEAKAMNASLSGTLLV